MSFRINTNISSLLALNNTKKTSQALNTSLLHLSSGLRINKASDDASGLSLADSLRAQSASLEQAIKNGNDAIGIVQTADNAMAEQLEIVETIRVKAIQAASDAQTRQSRSAIQADIIRLLEEFDNIANNTSFNGHKLLNGNFSNKHFQIGAYSNQTINLSIGNTNSNTIGHITYNTSTPFVYQNTPDFKDAVWTFRLNYGPLADQFREFDFSGADLLDKGLKTITDQINAVGKEFGLVAKAKSDLMPSVPILGSEFFGNFSMDINGVNVISGAEIKYGDSDGLLLNSINSYTNITGVTASNEGGALKLTSKDGLPIHIQANPPGVVGMVMEDETGNDITEALILGELTIGKEGSSSPSYSITAKNAAAQAAKGIEVAGLTPDANTKFQNNTSIAFETTNLRDFMTKKLDGGLSKAMGFGLVGRQGMEREGGVLSYEAAQIMIDIAVVAMKDLDKIRSDIGSAQNQIISAINNISVMQINLKAAQSQIRDVDFAKEAAEFNKQNILMQSGTYANAQANQIQNNIIKLLQ